MQPRRWRQVMAMHIILLLMAVSTRLRPAPLRCRLSVVLTHQIPLLSTIIHRLRPMHLRRLRRVATMCLTRLVVAMVRGLSLQLRCQQSAVPTTCAILVAVAALTRCLQPMPLLVTLMQVRVYPRQLHLVGLAHLAPHRAPQV
mmetsp:Transcript_67768/g.189140  ORF Transcript_67768/g.189140 Transcript_67768/m.189140 type:complete len:143 (-) Transcript_67768:729-1157(-)